MPRDRSSTAILAAKELMYDLVAPYNALKGVGWQAAAEEVNTTHPRKFFASIRVTKRCVICIADVALHSWFTISLARGLRKSEG